jgi:hypothetical protein
MSNEDRAAKLARLGPRFLDPAKIAAILVAPLRQVVHTQKVTNPHARIEAAASAIAAIHATRSASARRAWKRSPLLKAKRKK